MATVYLTGVLEDGSPPSPSVPRNPREQLAVTQASSTTIIVKSTNAAGVPLPATGTLALTIKQRPNDEPPLAQLVGTWTPSLGAGVAVFSFTPTTMQNAQWGRYLYDVRLTTTGGVVNRLIEASPFLLRPAI